MDEVLRACLCQLTCVNTMAALPSLGFYLWLITLYLLMPCRNMQFSPWWSWFQKMLTFHAAHGAKLLCLSKIAWVQMSASDFHPSQTLNSLKKIFRGKSCSIANLSLLERRVITSAFVPLTCPCRTEKSFEHTPRRAGNLPYGSLVKWPRLKNTLQKEWSLTAKESVVGFFLPLSWIGFQTSSQSESLYILSICHFQSIRPYALLTIILNYTY